MEDINQQISNQQEIIRDLQTRLSQSASEDEKKGIQLRMNVINAKIAELQNKQSQENVSEDTIKQGDKWVNKGEEGTHGSFDTKKAADDQRKAMFASGYKEDAPYQKIHFLDTDNNGNTIEYDSLSESTWKEQRANELRQRIKRAESNRDKVSGDARRKWQEGINDMRKQLQKVLSEGCMSKKFESMTNREVADYIFRHPHTKFASKMKECDDKEIMKAFRSLKTETEDAPATSTAAVAGYSKPFFKETLKRNI